MELAEHMGCSASLMNVSITMNENANSTATSQGESRFDKKQYFQLKRGGGSKFGDLLYCNIKMFDHVEDKTFRQPADASIRS
jgi:hypothetical protein